MGAMEKINQGKGNREYREWPGRVEWNLAIIYRVVREGFSDKIAL